MDINKFIQVMVITRESGHIKIIGSNGEEIHPDAAIDYLKDVKREQVKDASGK